jgi:hypothetical protein
MAEKVRTICAIIQVILNVTGIALLIHYNHMIVFHK